MRLRRRCPHRASLPARTRCKRLQRGWPRSARRAFSRTGRDPRPSSRSSPASRTRRRRAPQARARRRRRRRVGTSRGCRREGLARPGSHPCSALAFALVRAGASRLAGSRGRIGGAHAGACMPFGCRPRAPEARLRPRLCRLIGCPHVADVEARRFTLPFILPHGSAPATQTGCALRRRLFDFSGWRRAAGRDRLVPIGGLRLEAQAEPVLLERGRRRISGGGLSFCA